MPFIIAIAQFLAFIVLRIVIGFTAYFTTLKVLSFLHTKFNIKAAMITSMVISISIASILSLMAAPLFEMIS